MDASRRNRRTDAAARRALAMPDILAGKGVSEIAELHNVSETTVRRWMAEVKGDLLDGATAAVQKLNDNVRAAVDRLIRLTKSDNEKIALGAVNSLLDRAGVVKTERRELGGIGGAPLTVTIALTDEEALEAARRKA